MQVKKFEARSMKEALEMIKAQLGPDAIILSAKEINKGFGLSGEKSIEVTAAYSETVLHNKKFVESKFPTQQKEQFQKSAAKDQKEIMRQVIENQIKKINDEKISGNKTKNMKTHNAKMYEPAAQSKASASGAVSYKMTEKRYIDIDSDNESTGVYEDRPVANAFSQSAKKAWNDMEVTSLKQEIESLKQVMAKFQMVPQSFVQAHPGADFGVHYQMSAHYQKLTACGLMPQIAGDIIAQCQKQLTSQQQARPAVVESWIAKYILDTTPIATSMNEKFHLFVGISGSGKTSSLIKLASEMILNQRKRVAIISTDSSKVGAAGQMKIFTQILNVPLLNSRSQQDWSHVITHLENLDHVLVDFAGLNLRNQEEVNYIKRIMPAGIAAQQGQAMRTHLVLSSSTKDSDLLECAKRYQAFGYDDVIFTGLDEASQHGNIYNFVRLMNTGIFAFGIGTKIPEDFEFATAERVVDLLLKITQNTAQNNEKQEPAI